MAHKHKHNRDHKPDRWRESPEPELPAAHRGGFSLPAEGAAR